MAVSWLSGESVASNVKAIIAGETGDSVDSLFDNTTLGWDGLNLDALKKQKVVKALRDAIESQGGTRFSISDVMKTLETVGDCIKLAEKHLPECIVIIPVK